MWFKVFFFRVVLTLIRPFGAGISLVEQLVLSRTSFVRNGTYQSHRS